MISSENVAHIINFTMSNILATKKQQKSNKNNKNNTSEKNHDFEVKMDFWLFYILFSIFS